MIRRRHILARGRLAFLLGVSLAAWGGAAQAMDTERHADARHVPERNGNPAETRLTPYSGNLAACSSSEVISHFTSQFGAREAEYWQSGLSIVAVDRVSEIGFRTWGHDFIPRRYCSARVLLNNNRFAKVDYAIRDRLGLFMWGWDVDWCVIGLDRHKSYAPECRMARP
jgi:hypothetical protein